jgi:acyl-CoA thioester hydrolase
MPLEVRFSEVDSLGMVWHGNYLVYFEAAREAFGGKYGLGYNELMASRIVAPVVEAQVFYHSPGRVGDQLTVRAHFLWNDAPKLEILYEIHRPKDQRLLAEGRTLQLLTTQAGELLLTRPPLLQDYYQRWEQAAL